MQKIDADFHNARILVVEDYLVNLELTKEMLEMMNCAVDGAEDGEEALELYDIYEYDLIFMDIQMPKKDGFQTTSAIREAEEKGKKYTPIVALTANALAGDREKYLASGMDDYLSKPIRSTDLAKVLEKYIDK
ncbi:MAG: response regulator [Chlamydiales bacterium]|nr:response regulator [Chlamydiia bacterium]MCP5508369.1 response regulator [Chlamydiales bacterium]